MGGYGGALENEGLPLKLKSTEQNNVNPGVVNPRSNFRDQYGHTKVVPTTLTQGPLQDTNLGQEKASSTHFNLTP